MGVEIERKFLLRNEDWKRYSDAGTIIKQGYLSTDKERTVRVRICGSTGFITVKGKTQGASRLEFEYEIPLEDAEALLRLCVKTTIEKTRYLVQIQQHTWEIDVFAGQNKGLVLAEIELTSENEIFVKPDWLGDEVTEDHRYFNSYLSEWPFLRW